MSLIVDEPIKTPSPVEDTPIEAVNPFRIEGEAPDMATLRLVQAATIKASTDNTNLVEAFSALSQERGLSGKGARDLEASRLHDQTFQDARELFAAQRLTPETASEGLLAIQQVEAEENEKRSSDNFSIEMYASVISEDLSPEERLELATNLHLLDKLNDFTADISGWEIAKDVALDVLIAPKALWNAQQAWGTWNPWKAQATFQKTAAWFQGLPPDDRREVWDAFQEHLVDTMPRHRAALFLQGLIDPSLQGEGEDDLGFWGTIDAAAIGVGIAATALRLRKILNPIRAAAKAGDRERAADSNLLVMQGLDNGLGEAVGVDRMTANTNALPFLGETVDTATAAGELSPAVHERIFAFRDRLKEAFGDLAEGKTFVREGFLDDQDRSKAVVRITDEFNRYVSQVFRGNDKIVNLNGTKQTPDGVEFSFDVVSPDGSVWKDTYVGRFTTDDIGFWQSLPKGSIFLSEKAQALKTDFMSTVNAAIRLDNTAAAVANQLRKVIRDASTPIRGLKGKPRKERIQEVDSVLITGDDLGKEFTPFELRSGVNGVKLDESQIEYYYNMRGVINGLGILRNMEAHRAMDVRGVKTIAVGNERYLGEVVDEATEATRRLKGRFNIWKFDETDGGRVDATQLKMDEEYAKGFKLVRLEEDSFIGGNRYQHVLVKSDTVHPLPDVVLDLKRGYIPRVNPQATYFVQAFSPSSVDGVRDVLRKAVRSFDNKKEADAFAVRLHATARAEGFEEGTSFRVVEDGELEAFKAGDSGISHVGGLIYGKRARTKIPHNDGDAADVPRTSALEAVELLLENTKNFMSRNDWRMGLRKKWENTAAFHLGSRVSFDDPGAALANTDLRVAWEKINEFSGFMDKSERSWEALVKGTYEWAIGKTGRTGVSDFIMTQRHKDPAARLRAATFHTLLGMYNPIQLWVQAQGAAVAMAANISNPERGIRAFQRQHALTLLQHVGLDDSPATLKKIAAASGFDDVDEMMATKRLWDRSGFYDSTLSSADVEAAARGFPTSGDALRKFIDSGLMFFRAGELFNRRYGFLTAIDELGGARAVEASDDLLKQAMSRTNDLILNLGKSNRASWQKGLMSIPTQFMQIQTKTIETLLGLNGVSTQAERMKILMGQFALYGAAGMFGGQWAVRQIAAMSGKDQIDINNMDPAVLAAMTGGLTDWFLHQMGTDAIGSQRGALLNGMDQTLFALFTEESSAFQWLGGPSAVGPERVWKKLQQISPWLAVPQDINGEVSFAPQDVTDALKFIAEGTMGVMMSPFATGNQIDKFLLMRDLGVLRDQNGNLLAAPEGGFNWQTEWATLIGFKPELLQRKFDLSSINENVRKTVEFRTSMLLEGWDSFLMDHERARREGRDLTDEELSMHRKRREVIIGSISDPGVRQQVMESFRNKLNARRTGNTQLDRQMHKFYDNMVLDISNEFTSGTRLIQTREQ